MSNTSGVPTITQRLRQLDRRVLRENTPIDAAKWAKSVGRWRIQLGIAIFAALTIPFNLAVGNTWFSMALLPTVLISAFQAGRMCAEHERLIGKRTFGGRLRPPGV
jgi:hypothetical protein